MPVLDEDKCELPERLSDLLELAIGDLEKCETDPGYVVAMGSWHEEITPLDKWEVASIADDLDVIEDQRARLAEGRSVCAVCMAGAVMAQTCRAPREESVGPSGYDQDTERRLLALDLLRQGFVGRARARAEGIGFWDLTREERQDYERLDFEATRYERDPEQFKIEMRALVDDLREAGL